MPQPGTLRARGEHTLDAELASPRSGPAITSGGDALAARPDTQPADVARPKRDNIGERLLVLETVISDLSPVFADLAAPPSKRAAASDPSESPRAQLMEFSRIGGAAPDVQVGAKPLRPGESVAAIATRQRTRWSPHPEPAIMWPPAPSLARSNGRRSDPPRPRRDKAPAAQSGRLAWLWLIAAPVFLAAFSGAYYASDKLSKQIRQAAVEHSAPAVNEPSIAARSSALPLPASYGVYAVSRGELRELEALPFKAPDPRVRLSAEITKPSSTVLPDGRVVFVVYRRELLTGAPHKAAVRVVARVARRMTFADGKAVSADVQNSWRIRSDGYDFNVAPLGDNHEMVAIRPDTADLALPAGRYALIFGGLAYDFTVDGPVTDRAQCLESVMAANGQIYIECRAP